MSTGKQITPVDEIRSSLKRMEGEFKAALPPHIPAERFLRVAVSFTQNAPPALIEKCERKSLYGAFMRAAEEGLLPDGREGAIVPFKGKAKFMPMVAGICKKARNSGEILTINAKSVFEKDEYDSWTDEKGEHFTHRQAKGDRGEYLLTYAYATTKDGGFYFEEIDAEQMGEIEKSSRAQGDSPWKGPFRDEMRRKSAIRRLAKYRLPSSTDLDDAVRADDEMYELSKNEKPEKSEKVVEGPKRLAAIIDSDSDEERSD